MNITLLSGSSRTPNFSYRIAINLKAELEKNHPQHTVSILDIRNFQVDFVQNTFGDKALIPERLRGLGELTFDADAFILISPEYNGSYSSVMKNLLDHFPKFSKKVFGICTYSTGALGGMRAAQQMQNMICGFFGIACPQMLLVGAVQNKIDENGNFIDISFQKNVSTFLGEFTWLGEAIEAAKK